MPLRNTITIALIAGLRKPKEITMRKQREFLLRMPTSLHTELGYAATKTFRSMNGFICQAIMNEITRVYRTKEPQDTVLTGDPEADKRAMIRAEQEARG